MTGAVPEFEIVVRGGHPDFLDIPWATPLAEWDDARLVPMAHGISRHVVRVVRHDRRVYAIKETAEGAAEAEHRALRALWDVPLPVVEPVGLVHTRPAGGAARLITRYLDFSLPYWYVIGREAPTPADVLLDAAVVLLVRLHLAGVFWGDCSPSNILFRRDAGAMMAYLVDAETTEIRPSIGDALRAHDVEIAHENLVGGALHHAGTTGSGRCGELVTVSPTLVRRPLDPPRAPLLLPCVRRRARRLRRGGDG